MLFQHFREPSREEDGLSLDQPRRLALGSGKSVEFRTEWAARTLRHLRRSADPAAVDSLALRIASNSDLETFLFRLSKTDALRDLSVQKLNEAIAFQARYPGWWEQAVEAPLEALAEEHRKTIDDKWDLTQFDLGVGATKGAYQFAKGTVVGIADLFKLAYSLASEADARERALELMKAWTIFTLKLYFGTDQQKQEAAKTARDFAQSLFDSVRDSMQADWDKAVQAGKETELVAKWVTLGVLEIATAVLAVTKGARAARAAERMAETAEIATTPVGTAVKVKKGRKPKSRLDRVNRAEQRVGRQLLEEWLMEHPSIYLGRSSMRADPKTLARQHRSLAKHMQSARRYSRIRKIKLRPGTVVEQWTRTGGVPGIFSTPLGSDPAKLGIDLQGRILVRYKVKQTMEVLETVIEDFKSGEIAGVGGNGGGIQYILPPEWGRYVQKTN